MIVYEKVLKIINPSILIIFNSLIDRRIYNFYLFLQIIFL